VHHWPSITKIEAGFMLEKDASLTEIEVEFMQEIIISKRT